MIKSRKIKKQDLINANGSNAFWQRNGGALYNLKDLLKALKKMKEEDFNFHVNNGKNDYANWIGAVLMDKKLAGDIKKTKKLKTTIAKVEKRLKDYNI